MKVNDPRAVINELIDLIYKQGYSTIHCVEHLKDKYDIAQTRCYQLIKDARIQAAEFLIETRNNALEDAISKLEILYQKAMEDGNVKLALNVQQELNKILELGKDKEIKALKEGVIINIVKPKEEDK